MKKLGFLLALGTVFVSSCKKNYTCTCTYIGTGNGNGGAGIYVIPDVTKQQATTICLSHEIYPSTSTQSTKCSL